MKQSSLIRRFFALPAAARWQVGRPVLGMAAAFVILVGGIRWYRLNCLPVVDITGDIPDAAKYGNVSASLRQSADLLAALQKVDYNPFKVPQNLLHLPDEELSEARKRFGMTKNASSFAFPQLGSSPKLREMTQEIVFSNDNYVRHNPKGYNGDIVKTHATGFVIVGWKSGKITTVPVEDVRLAVDERTHAFTEVYPGMKAYDPNGLHIPAIEFADGKMTPKYQAFLKATLATDDTQTCRKK